MIDFSSATKLKKVALRFELGSILWAAKALNTITREHRDLQEVSVHITFCSASPGFRSLGNARRILGEQNYAYWMKFDCLLLRLCEWHAICVKARFCIGNEEEAREYAAGLLPETTKGGTTGLVEDADL